MNQTDEEIIVLGNLDFEPACETTWCMENPRTAEWIVYRTVCPQCGRDPRFFCSPCKERSLSINGKFVFCSVCDHTHMHRTYSVEPLK